MLKRSFHKLLKASTGNIFVQAVRYGISGGTAFFADFLLLYLLTDLLHVHYLLSSAAGFSLGLLITYLLSIYWIFDQRRFDNRLREVVIFILIGVAGLLFTALFMWLFTTVAGLHYLLSKILTTIITTLWNFLAKKFILFSRK